MKLVLSFSLVILFSISGWCKGDPAKGKLKAATCIACHGAKGVSNSDLWPNLAGQKHGYLVKQIKAFKAGTRNEPLMAPMVAGLSDADIENLAAYYSALK